MTGICRCGHGRTRHYPTANAWGKRRRNGDRRPPHPSCHAVVVEPFSYYIYPNGNPSTVSGTRRVECKCRKFVEA